ncbi:MAG TPA: class I SAM-dependent methyltransferase [Myxococcota bacterium]|nr:class I SAM-dependent methyltransferase [Myxococcota bacterium]
MAAGDRERWDARFRAGGHRGEARPSWLEAFAAELPRAGRALDVASGTGRVARFWAGRGLESLAVDVSGEALRLAREAAERAGLRIETRELDLELDPLPDGPFAAISCFHYLQRDLFPRMRERLTPGGVLVCEIATRLNLERHASPSARFLLEPDELRALCAGLELVSYSEEWHEEERAARAERASSAAARSEPQASEVSPARCLARAIARQFAPLDPQ